MCSLSKIKLKPFRPILCQKITPFWIISKSQEWRKGPVRVRGEEERGQQQHIKVRYFVLLYIQLSSVWSVPLFYSLYVTFFTFAEENKLNKLNFQEYSKSFFGQILVWSRPQPNFKGYHESFYYYIWNVESLSKSISYFFKVIFWPNPCTEQTPTQF